MLIVYVKHYLTVGGMVFFQDWLQRVKSIMSQQSGYESVIHNASSDNDVCVNIIVKFENEETLNSWAEHPVHHYLVTALDPHRKRDYLEATCVADENMPYSTIEWEKIGVVR